MINKSHELTEEERLLIEETERFMEKVSKDEKVMATPLPDGLEEKLFEKVREIEEIYAKMEEMSREREELIRLGRIYKKKRKRCKYYVLAAVVVMALACGVTSIGGPEKILEKFQIAKLGRDQSQINSGDGVKVVENDTEEEVYQQIEDEYGFYPVKIAYMPQGMDLLFTKIHEETQEISLFYGNKETVKMVYYIYPNYRDASLGKYGEDPIIEQFELETEGVAMEVKKYLIKDSDEQRWTVEFVYGDVAYFLRIADMKKEEVQKVAENLSFS